MSEFAAEAASMVTEGREWIGGLMVDTCKITKPGAGDPVLDEGTLEYTYPAKVVVYQGPFRMQVRADINANVVEITAGEREWTYQTATGQIPITTPTGATGNPADVRVDQTVEVLTCVHDPGIVGRLFHIRGITYKSHATHRKVRMTEAVG